MDDSRPEIPKEDVVPSLWREYQKTTEYRTGRVESINSTHPLVRFQESRGLGRIINRFIGRLKDHGIVRLEYQNRSVTEWLNEWYAMHELLFKSVLKERGRFRRKDVRFGAPGDEEIHRIPHWQNVMREMQEYAHDISAQIAYVDQSDLDSICTYLARVHYQFIRIHPFEDGNGRIARAVTDQLGICLGLPPIIAGFPRTVQSKKKAYHAAIKDCAGDGNCASLKNWILDQVKAKIEGLA